MPEKATSKPLLIPVRADVDLAAAGKPLPAILQTATRGGAGAPDPFLANVVVEQSYPLAAVGRGEMAKPEKIEDSRKLLALEAVDGTTVFIRTDRLQEELERLCPEAVGKDGIDLARFGDREATTRGGIGWPWSKLSVISLGEDTIIDTARDKALEWAKDWLGEKVEKAAEAGASWLGAKALMWAIESQLAGKPGLYQWNGGELAASDRRDKDDPRLVSAAKEGPLLVFVHGTGSHTLGGFKDLRATTAAEWELLADRFGERVFGFEHRTFSESPIDNALALTEAIPAGARLSLVTHSRGGLVGDLLCLGALDDALINAYRREAPVNEKETSWQKRVREKVAAEEQRKLRELRRLLDTKQFQIERYVRVAAPARGTALLSDNLDLFLSCFLSLTSTLVGALTGPAGSAVMSAFKRIVLEIADKRVEARLVPGIEAMLTDSPLGVLLAQAPRRQGVAMAVITGDMDGGGILKRLGVMFTDWMFFDRADNDLVVDTASMYAGLARGGDTRYLYDQGELVNHFSYFANRITRTALRDWLTVAAPVDLPAFDLLEEGREPTAIDAREKARGRAAMRGTVAPDSRPVVIVLPGIMGSHLERRDNTQEARDGDRVWLDVRDLMAGGLSKIRFDAQNVYEESLFEMFYGGLCDHLEASHAVIPFPYDWRQPIQDTADKLAGVVRKELDRNPPRPIRLLAHSMGGLVARAMIAKDAKVWNELIGRAGGRFIMLGTPNNGSHLMVETLLGKADTIRHLARLDFRHRMQDVLDIIAGFPGALQLLPRPGFKDSGGEQEDDYFRSDLWPRYRATNRDRWFGNGLAAAPTQNVLDKAAALWKDNLLGNANTVPNPDHLAYVFGQAENTPCGIRLEGDRLKMVGTSEGDGSVTWASGRLENLPRERCWHMPVAHGNLANSEEHFPAILDLLQTGETNRLGRLPVSRGMPATRSYDAGPAPYPTEEELTRSLLGAKPQRRKARRARQRLAVRVVAGDLRYIQLPVMCGHYIGDPISGAEYQIDQYVVDGALSQRERLGLYASEIGTSVVVLNPRSEEDQRRGTRRGAVVIGLGEFGKLRASSVTKTVSAGVLRFLLHTHDCRSGAEQAPEEVGLASLLIGYNSTANISVEDAVSAVVRGVCEANRQFEDAMGPKLRVARLDLVELFLDNAITAANAIRDIPKRQERDLRRLGVTLEAADRLIEREGVRIRLSATSSFGYWPRLMVTGDDLKEDHARSRTALAKRLKYVFLAERARAEAVVHQRQPGLIEALVKNAIHQENFNPDLARTLFQLMVPLDFKATVRDTERLVLMLDGYTANLPWEMLQADEQPMALKTRLVRQFVSTRFRPVVRPPTSKTACIIADPSTDGFQKAFGKDQPLPQLPDAAKEADSVRDLLTAVSYQVEFVPPGSMALDVMARLFRRPYRILIVAAHGEFELTAQDGSKRSGVVLSDGIVLTAAEIGQLEVVPDLVFLNCCHLAKIDKVPASERLADSNRLAYSLARELIEMGVRCVMAAGWRVNDQAAGIFATTFFDAFVARGRPFGEAVHEARKEAYDKYPDFNTWGAYQAYGDPGFVLEPDRGGADALHPAPVAPQELVAELDRLRLSAGHARTRDFKKIIGDVRDRLNAAPADWSDLPEVQFALGTLYGEFGTEGFEMACAAWERAIAEQDKAGRVPIRAIEQLANLESRIGEKKGGEEGLDLIKRAITRLDALRTCAAVTLGQPGEKPEVMRRVNAERFSILGSALKRKAALLAKKEAAKWNEIGETLEHSREAYAAGEGDPRSAQFDPYPALNHLQLTGLLHEIGSAELDRLVETAKRCADVARQRFAASFDFFDAVMAADAELAIHMIKGSLKGSAADLVRAYREAVSSVPKSARQFDSVIKQLQLLAQFYSLRGKPDDAQNATALREIARELDPNTAAPAEATPEPGKPNASHAQARPAGGETASSPAARTAPEDKVAKRTRKRQAKKP